MFLRLSVIITFHFRLFCKIDLLEMDYDFAYSERQHDFETSDDFDKWAEYKQLAIRFPNDTVDFQ